jgi:hypothetical protein
MLGRRFLVVALGLSSALAVGVFATSGGAASSAQKTIASASTSDFRVAVTATKRGAGGAPTAAVTLTTSERAGSGWRRTGTHRLGGTYFWYTVTGPLAVCRLELRTTAAQPRFRPHAIVQLLRSPSLGCGPTSRFAFSG